MNTTKKIIIIAAIMGMILSAFLTYSHYQGAPFCLGNQEESCDTINQSIWSELFGIPVAIFGFLTFALFAGGIVFEKRHKHIPKLMFILAIIGTGFETYITYMGKTVLDTFCTYCLIIYSLLIITLICTIIRIRKK